MSGIVASIPLGSGRGELARRQMRSMLKLLTDPSGHAESTELQLEHCAIGYVQRPPVKSRIVSDKQVGETIAVVDGHIYDSISDGIGSDRSVAAQVLRRYQENGNLTFEGIDGLFAGLVYDAGRSRLIVFSDQFGLRRLYYSVRDGVVYLASEVKAFLALEGAAPSISSVSVSSFFAYGVLAENKTWLDDVFLLPPAAALTWDVLPAPTVRSFQISIEETRDVVTFDAACRQAGALFQKAIDKRCEGLEHIGVRLSGGLDSRAIVAALSAKSRAFDTFTFGRPGSLDARIAKYVSTVAKSEHHEYEFTPASWFKHRVEAVWISDGHLDVQNMHGMPDIFSYGKLDAHLCGDLGGGIIGGLFFDTWPTMPTIAVLNNRLRRFSGESSAYNFHFMDERCPFYDLELLQFLFRLPSEFLRDSRLYRRMLLQQYGRFYRTIPWQHTGAPIWVGGFLQTVVRFGLIASTRSLAKFIDPEIDVAYHLNRVWFRQNPVRVLIEEILLSSHSLFSDYLDAVLSRNRIREHLSGRRDHVEFLSKLLTFEIWLRSVRDRRALSWG